MKLILIVILKNIENYFDIRKLSYMFVRTNSYNQINRMQGLKLYITLFLVICTTAGMAQTVDTLTIQSDVFNKPRKVKVMLPADYSMGRNIYEKYIVAYLFDSQSEDFFNFYKTTVDLLIKQGNLQPLILVGIASDNRQFEFLTKAQTEEGKNNFRKTGGADSLALHLKNEVIPAIQNKYRTNGYNVGIGHSLGGTFVSYALLKYPSLFNAAIAISPNYQYDKEYMVQQFDKLANAQNLNHKFLYIAHGYGDATEEKFAPSAKKVEGLLAKKNISGLRWVFKSMDNDSHSTTAMEGIFKGLIALNKQLNLSDEKVEKFISDKRKPFIENVKDYYQSASEWAGIKLPVVNEINNAGYGLLFSKRNKEAIELMTWGISIYPRNTNLYDSLAEVQLESGDKQASLKWYMAGLNEVKNQKQTLDPKRYDQLIAGFEKNINKLNK